MPWLDKLRHKTTGSQQGDTPSADTSPNPLKSIPADRMEAQLLKNLRRDAAAYGSLETKAASLQARIDARQTAPDGTPMVVDPAHGVRLKAKISELRTQMRKLEEKKDTTLPYAPRRYTRVPHGVMNFKDFDALVDLLEDLKLLKPLHGKSKAHGEQLTPFVEIAPSAAKVSARYDEIRTQMNQLTARGKLIDEVLMTSRGHLLSHLDNYPYMHRFSDFAAFAGACCCIPLLLPLIPFLARELFVGRRAKAFTEQYALVLYPEVLRIRAQLNQSILELQARNNTVDQWRSDQEPPIPPEVARALAGPPRATIVCPPTPSASTPEPDPTLTAAASV